MMMVIDDDDANANDVNNMILCLFKSGTLFGVFFLLSYLGWYFNDSFYVVSMNIYIQELINNKTLFTDKFVSFSLNIPLDLF